MARTLSVGTVLQVRDAYFARQYGETVTVEAVRTSPGALGATNIEYDLMTARGTRTWGQANIHGTFRVL